MYDYFTVERHLYGMAFLRWFWAISNGNPQRLQGQLRGNDQRVASLAGFADVRVRISALRPDLFVAGFVV